ncbi:MAG: threonine/serine exporter family protein [Kyrpidia sp.]|nr:threonine/serine exporter family protein [Kyrpidia sp.]
MEHIMAICLRAGAILLRSGAETARVEETITRLALAAGVDKVDTFVTPTGIFICLEKGGESLTRLTRVHARATDLQKVTEVNHLSRRFVRGDLSLEDLEERLSAMETMPPLYPRWLQALAGFVSAGSYSFLLSGHWRDVLPSALGGLVAHLVYGWKGGGRGGNVLRVFLGGVAGSAAAVAAAWVEGDVSRVGHVVVGAMIPLVPGVAVTTAVRDLLAGDLLSGMARGTEALLAAVAIAIAVGLVLGVVL